jgi:hypothetical protein
MCITIEVKLLEGSLLRDACPSRQMSEIVLIILQSHHLTLKMKSKEKCGNV